MAYNGSTQLISGIIQANNKTFPLVHADDVQVGDNASDRLPSFILPKVTTTNDSALLQVVDGVWSIGIKVWIGSASEYAAIRTKDARTLYFITG